MSNIKLKNRKYKLSYVFLALLSSNLLFAQNNQVSLEQIDVTDSVTSSKASLTGLGSKVILSKQNLDNMRATTLADTLGKVSGVQSNAFGPNVGRPIIRGLSGQRVQILQNDTPLNDMAAISGNLATSANILSAKEIQVVKSGVASVLYGGKSIGGAVNLSNGAIPSTLSSKAFSGSVALYKGLNTVDNYRVQLEGNDQRSIAWYMDASLSEVSSRKIPNHAKDPICFNYEYLKTATPLRHQCQVQIERLGSSINPKYFPYISKFYLDNHMDPDYGLSEGDKYTKDAGNAIRGINPPNPDYVPNSPYYVDNFGPLEEYVVYPKGRIPNSHMRTKQLTLGASYIKEQGYFGISFNHFHTLYGVPGFAYLASSVANQDGGYLPIQVSNETNRINLQGALKQPVKWLNRVDMHISYQQSRDNEFLGTKLSNGLNSSNQYYRLSFDHEPFLFNRVVGSLGMGFNQHKVASLGADSYLPSVNTKSKALFALEKIDFSPFILEVGQRWDRIEYDVNTANRVTSGSTGGAYSKDKTFSVSNTHIGLLFQPQENWFIKLQRGWQERAPEINELYADNNHYALLIEENGDGRLTKESSYNWDISTGLTLDNLSLELTGYKRDFQNFKYLGVTGNSRNGLVNRVWREAPVKLRGVEFDLNYSQETQYLGNWNWHFFVDYVKAQLKLPIPKEENVGNATFIAAKLDNQNYGISLPNIPTSRIGADLNIQFNRWNGFISIVHYLKQKNVSKEIDEGQNVMAVPAFTMVDLGLSYTYPLKNTDLEISLKVNNLTNTDARLNGSPLRFLAPLSGRNANLGITFRF